MKNSLTLSLLALSLSGAALGAAGTPVYHLTTDLKDLVTIPVTVTIPDDYTGGYWIGGPNDSQHPGVTEINTINKDSSYTNLKNHIDGKKGWYTDHLCSNVGDAKSSLSVNGQSMLFITDGPQGTSHPNFAVAGFTLTATTVAEMAAVGSGLTFSFNVSVPTGNNNKNDQSIGFKLLSAAGDGTGEDLTYSNGNGKNTLAADKSITLSADQVAALAASKTDQVLYFMVYDTDNVNGTNEGWVLRDFKASYSVPEPATATLSLLAMAGLLARRRRK